MNYKSVRSARFEDEALRLPRPVLNAVNRHIEQLEQNPGIMSRPAFPPLPSGQVTQLSHTFDDMEFLIDIVFKYGADETTLYLEHLFFETM